MGDNSLMGITSTFGQVLLGVVLLIVITAFLDTAAASANFSPITRLIVDFIPSLIAVGLLLAALKFK